MPAPNPPRPDGTPNHAATTGRAMAGAAVTTGGGTRGEVVTTAGMIAVAGRTAAEDSGIGATARRPSNRKSNPLRVCGSRCFPIRRRSI